VRLTYARTGRPEEVLEPTSEPSELPGEGVLVRLIARPVLPMDLLQLRGLYPWKVELPAVAGAAGCGRVLEGPHAGRLALLPIRWGTWCAHSRVPQDQLVLLPEIDPVQASNLVVNGASAHFLLEGLGEGDHVVSSPAGSLGQLVDQLCASRGIACTHLVRRPPAGPMAGAVVTELPSGMGADRAIDGVGGEITAQLGAAVRRGGTVWHYGAMSRQAPKLHVADAIFRDVRLRGFWLRRVAHDLGAEAIRAVLSDLATQSLSVAVAGCYPLHRWREALEHAQQPDRRGQVFLVDPEQAES
jgi:NADPH:quinone reductase-like Zn-dependent oxidoreductase